MYKDVAACRICGNAELTPILSLGKLAMSGVFPRDPKQNVESGPLDLLKCSTQHNPDACGLVQLRQSYDPAGMYGVNYGYRSGLNRSMVKHLAGIVHHIAELVSLESGDLVIDIGSNDCTTLKHYGREDLRLVGIDPTGVKFAEYYPPHVELIADFFSADRVRRQVGERKARVVTSIAMFYDLESPLDFMREIYEILADDGVWVFEQSYLPAMLKTTSYDTICHEHLEFYALRQIKWMADRVGFKIVDVQFNDVNGGSFQVVVAKQASSMPEATRRLNDLLMAESRNGVDSLPVYRAFHDRVLQHRDDLRSWLHSAKRQGRQVLGYGASTKGNVLLQFCGITAQDVACIAEVNEDKYGCWTPGTLIPIVSEVQARSTNPDCLLVLPWHFREGILRRESDYIARGGRFLFPLPSIEVVGSTQRARAA